MRPAPLLAATALGLAAGIGGATFHYAEGLSYLSADPRACANCHIMEPQFATWQTASHHTAAACVDCHLPVGFPEKYIAKAANGWNHSRALTTQDFPEPIMITAPNAAILQDNCVRCHDALLHDASAAVGAPRCVGCHVAVGHGEQVGLGGPPRPGEYPEPHALP